MSARPCRPGRTARAGGGGGVDERELDRGLSARVRDDLDPAPGMGRKSRVSISAFAGGNTTSAHENLQPQPMVSGTATASSHAG